MTLGWSRIRRVAVFLGWTFVILAGINFIQRDVARYLTFTEEAYHRHWVNRGWLVAHMAGAVPAVLVAPFQFSRRLRTRRPRWHRVLGRIYIFGGLVASAAAFRLALATNCEACIAPLSLLALLWFSCTAVALIAALRGAFELHRQFVIRSYVLMYAFAVIRVMALLPSPVKIADPESHRATFEWASWVIPLIITEACLSWIPALKRGWRSAARPMPQPPATPSPPAAG